MQSFIVSDSINYYQSGLDLIATGRLTYRGGSTALIMPGISIVIGLCSLLFADGPALVLALRVLWILMGSLVPLYIYRSLRLYTRRSTAFLGSLVYLMPWHVQIDCFLLTECPYYLFFAMALYYTLKLGKAPARQDAVRYALSVLAALLFRPNILIFVAFSFAWWLLRRIPLRDLLKRALVLAAVLAVFIVPWSIRNWVVFHDFIPVTYGAGNPLFEGSYQGENPPTDEEIHALYPDVDVYALVAEKRPDLMDAQGHVYDPDLQDYADMIVNGELGHIRLRGWWTLRPLGMLKSYLLIKPRTILNWVWYYIELGGISFGLAHRMRQLGFLFCLFTVALSLIRRRFRRETLFLLIAYLINLLLIASSYAIDRYAQMLMPYRYLLMGLGLELCWECWELWRRRSQGPAQTHDAA